MQQIIWVNYEDVQVDLIQVFKKTTAVVLEL